MLARRFVTSSKRCSGSLLWIALACGASERDAASGTETDVDPDTGSSDVSVPTEESDGVLDDDDADTTASGGTPNEAPVAEDDALQAWLSATTSLTPLANDTDSDADIDPTSVVITTPPLHGTATVELDGTVTYVHYGSAERVDSMIYEVADTTGLWSAPATIELTISGPVVLDGDVWSTSEETDFPATAAVDGDPTSRWSSTWSARGGHVLELDLGGWHRLSEVSAELGPGDGMAPDPDFALQYWDGCWRTFEGGLFHDAVDDSVTISPGSVVTTRIRYMCTTLGGACTLRELTVSGVPEAAPESPVQCTTGALAPVLHPDYAYAVFLPVGYEERGTTWPVVVSYHGIGGVELTADYSAVVAQPEGVPRRLATEPAFAAELGAIVIAPHCRLPGAGGTCWFAPDPMERMFVHALRDWNIDADRVSVVGLSGGAIRGWDLVIRRREQIAAFLAIASDYFGEYIDYGPGPDYDPAPAEDGRHFCDLIDFPISAYHGTADTDVDYDGPTATPALDEQMNSRCDATDDVFDFDPNDFPGRSHAIWDDVFADDQVYTWLLDRRVSDRPSP